MLGVGLGGGGQQKAFCSENVLPVKRRETAAPPSSLCSTCRKREREIITQDTMIQQLHSSSPPLLSCRPFSSPPDPLLPPSASPISQRRLRYILRVFHTRPPLLFLLSSVHVHSSHHSPSLLHLVGTCDLMRTFPRSGRSARLNKGSSSADPPPPHLSSFLSLLFQCFQSFLLLPPHRRPLLTLSPPSPTG